MTDRKTFTGEIGSVEYYEDAPTRIERRVVHRYLAKKYLPRWQYLWMRLRRKV